MSRKVCHNSSCKAPIYSAACPGNPPRCRVTDGPRTPPPRRGPSLISPPGAVSVTCPPARDHSVAVVIHRTTMIRHQSPQLYRPGVVLLSGHGAGDGGAMTNTFILVAVSDPVIHQSHHVAAVPATTSSTPSTPARSPACCPARTPCSSTPTPPATSPPSTGGPASTSSPPTPGRSTGRPPCRPTPRTPGCCPPRPRTCSRRWDTAGCPRRRDPPRAPRVSSSPSAGRPAGPGRRLSPPPWPGSPPARTRSRSSTPTTAPVDSICRSRRPRGSLAELRLGRHGGQGDLRAAPADHLRPSPACPPPTAPSPTPSSSPRPGRAGARGSGRPGVTIIDMPGGGERVAVADACRRVRFIVPASAARRRGRRTRRALHRPALHRRRGGGTPLVGPGHRGPGRSLLRHVPPLATSPSVPPSSSGLPTASRAAVRHRPPRAGARRVTL